MKVDADALLLDTNALIWLAAGAFEPTVIDRIEAARAAGDILVSPASAWEVGLLGRERAGRPPRYSFHPDPERWFGAFMEQPGIRHAPLTSEIAIAAVFLPGFFHDDPADRFLIATARALDVPLMTRDRTILAYAEAGHVRALAC